MEILSTSLRRLTRLTHLSIFAVNILHRLQLSDSVARTIPHFLFDDKIHPSKA